MVRITQQGVVVSDFTAAPCRVSSQVSLRMNPLGK
jgi:hypothetical protein